MNPSNQDDFLREIVADADLETVRERTLWQGVRQMRARRRRRRLTAITAAIVPLVMLVALVWRPSLLRVRSTRPLAMAASLSPAASLSDKRANGSFSPTKTAAVKIINKDQLLALFPGRSMALIGKPGRQELVFLDAPASQMPASPSN